MRRKGRPLTRLKAMGNKRVKCNLDPDIWFPPISPQVCQLSLSTSEHAKHQHHNGAEHVDTFPKK
jgi:hypothetical protein